MIAWCVWLTVLSSTCVHFLGSSLKPMLHAMVTLQRRKQDFFGTFHISDLLLLIFSAMATLSLKALTAMKLNLYEGRNL